MLCSAAGTTVSTAPCAGAAGSGASLQPESARSAAKKPAARPVSRNLMTPPVTWD
ncbi:MAG: hypothetical protein ACLUNV_09360 [Sutterella wadsworthensis]